MEGIRIYATIRIYQNTTRKDEIARRVEDEFIPLLKTTSGFRGWYIVDGGDGSLASVTPAITGGEVLRSVLV